MSYHCTKLEDAKKILEQYGVVVIDNYFPKEYADKVFNDTKKWLIDLDIGLTNDESTWIDENTPLGPKYGLYQSIISHCPMFWDLREKFYDIYKHILNTDDLITSIDGASFYPGSQRPKNNNDWAHIDQTIDSEFRCIQGQFVSTDTTGSLVATIGSHLKHPEVLKLSDIKDKESNWHKFNNKEVKLLKAMFGKVYQQPIYATAGSVILWDSRTIHSAKFPDKGDNTWRGAFYCSMLEEEDANVKIIQEAAIKGRTTNHWGSHIFDIKLLYNKKKNDKVMDLLNNSERLSYVDKMTPLQKQICGL